MPLKKICSVKSFNANVKREIRRGRSQEQAVAIAYATLKKSCGVRTRKRLTPKKIVKKGRSR